MGITGLLPLLKNTIDVIHISEYKNQKVGIDAYAWLVTIKIYIDWVGVD